MHDKETVVFDVSPDGRYLGSVGNGRSEIVILDIENGFKQINKVSFGIFDKKWDLILSSEKMHFWIFGRNLVAFFSEKLTFRFINFGRSKQATFNFLSQNKFVKFDVKPADEKELMPLDADVTVLPVHRVKIENEGSEIETYRVVK